MLFNSRLHEMYKHGAGQLSTDVVYADYTQACMNRDEIALDQRVFGRFMKIGLNVVATRKRDPQNWSRKKYFYEGILKHEKEAESTVALKDIFDSNLPEDVFITKRCNDRNKF